MPTMFDGFYQIGFIARDLDRAVATLGRRLGISRFRHRRAEQGVFSEYVYLTGAAIGIYDDVPRN
jgi:hypothetical protein